jgi:hypothetical protein
MDKHFARFVQGVPVVDVHEHHMPEENPGRSVGLLQILEESYAGWTQVRPYPLPGDSMLPSLRSGGELREDKHSEKARTAQQRDRISSGGISSRDGLLPCGRPTFSKDRSPPPVKRAANGSERLPQYSILPTSKIARSAVNPSSTFPTPSAAGAPGASPPGSRRCRSTPSRRPRVSPGSRGPAYRGPGRTRITDACWSRGSARRARRAGGESQAHRR